MTPSTETPKRTRDFAVGLGISLVVIGIYNALFFNRYLPLSEGWFSVYAHYMLNGAMPYRDFHFFLSPLYPGIQATFTQVFGPSLIALRVFGIAITLSITLTLFLLYSRLFPAYVACIVTIVSVIYYESNVTFIGYNFLNLLHLFALFGIFLICKYYDYDDHSLKSSEGRRATIFLFCAGLFGSLAFLTKQSDGSFALMSSLLAVAIVAYAKEGLRKALSTVAIYSVGIFVPILALLIWLISNGVLGSFWDQVVVGASSSKGGLVAILFNWIPRLFIRQNVGGLVVAILTIIALRIYCFPQGFMLGSLGDKNHKDNSLSMSRMVVIFSATLLLFILCVLLPFWSIELSHELYGNHFLNFIYYGVLLITGFTGSLLLFCIFFVKIIREKKAAYFDIFIILTVSLGLLWGTSTSGGIGDMGMIVALGLLLGYLFIISARWHLTKIGLTIVCVFLVLFMASRKYTVPYYWWGLNEPDIRTTSTSLESEYLHGFVLSKQTARIYSEVASIVDENTRPGDSIYSFPNIPIFYLLTDRYPNTFGIVSWFDVEPDRFALNDAQRIRESPPKVIIYLNVPEYVWEAHEQMFRSGEMSGQGMIREAIESLTSSGNYQLEAKYDVPSGYSLSVWTKIEGIDSNTKLLLHFDGTNGSTVPTDEMGHDLTVIGNAHIDTSEKRFGTASGSFDGRGGLKVANSADLDFGSEDFTIDGWFYFNAESVGYQFLIDGRGSSDQTGWVFYLENDNSLSFLSASATDWDNLALNDTGIVPETGRWIHLAIVRNGNVFTMYKDGIAVKSGTNSGSIGSQTIDLTIGLGHVSPWAGFNGYMDELRISKGVARWTANFTPPAAPYAR